MFDGLSERLAATAQRLRGQGRLTESNISDALRDVRKHMQRNFEAFTARPEDMPVFGTIASHFNDDGVTALYQGLSALLAERGFHLGAQHTGGLHQIDEKARAILHHPGAQPFGGAAQRHLRYVRNWSQPPPMDKIPALHERDGCVAQRRILRPAVIGSDGEPHPGEPPGSTQIVQQLRRVAVDAGG